MIAKAQNKICLMIDGAFEFIVALAVPVFFFTVITGSFSEAATSECGSASTEFPLHPAAKYGAVEEVLCLIASGRDINALDALGYTPLGTAAAFGRFDVVTALTMSADLDARKIPPVHAAMLSPMDSFAEDTEQNHEDSLSSFEKRIGIMRALVAAGADVEVPGVVGEDLLPSLIHFGCFQNRVTAASSKASLTPFMSLIKLVVAVSSDVDDQQIIGLASLLNFPLDDLFDRKCLTEATETILSREYE